MSFNLKNIGNHPASTLWGILFMSALLAFVGFGKCKLEDIKPFALLVVPFLFYGRGGTPPAAMPDSTTGPELAGIGAPGAPA